MLLNLAMNLCPDFGTKGFVDHESVNEKSFEKDKEVLIEYMKTDILLLGRVMQKAQNIYWKLYQLDIESKITLLYLALKIFRLRYYNDEIFPIYIPNQNKDTFIRKAYYRGHTDSYKPYGKNLYPFVMKEYPMPCGNLVRYSNIEDMDIDRMLGFIEAYVVCLKTIKKPFLPYHSKTGTLIFPTGEFIGVYYSEELKYAVGLGYKVVPISGYLFERKESPFKDFVSSLFSSRLEARKEGNDALSYVYKILMNSLYGRFGINPKSTITEVCNFKRYTDVVSFEGFIHRDMLSENNFIVSYYTNTGNDRTRWSPPKNSAVQLAADITASARIYMYPYISRDDCYYTDTDSVVLSQPLPEELISSLILGMLKLEDQIVKGLKEGSKRLPVYSSNKNWVDTEPIAIHDLSNIDYINRKVISSLSDRVLHLENERLNEKLE
ncbi:DNA polymerase-like protein [Tanacetum coccineum]